MFWGKVSESRKKDTSVQKTISSQVLHSNQSLPTCSTTIPTAVPHRAINLSHQLTAYPANYSIPPLIPQPTIVGRQTPPH